MSSFSNGFRKRRAVVIMSRYSHNPGRGNPPPGSRHWKEKIPRPERPGTTLACATTTQSSPVHNGGEERFHRSGGAPGNRISRNIGAGPPPVITQLGDSRHGIANSIVSHPAVAPRTSRRITSCCFLTPIRVKTDFSWLRTVSTLTSLTRLISFIVSPLTIIVATPASESVMP